MENQNLNNTRSTKSGDASLHSKRFRSGAYAVVVSVFVIIAVIGVNLMVSMLDIRSDMTATGKYSLTNETKTLLGTINDKITIYYLTKENKTISWLETFFDEYQKECKNITVKQVDLLLNPKFAEQYTSETVTQHSLVVVNETNGRSRYVSYQSLLIFEYGLDANYQYTENITGVDIEGQINSALRYVTTGEQTNFYALTGHGELALGSEAQVFLKRSNVVYHSLNLVTEGKVPEDCDVLYIAIPATDYTDAELAAIREYTKAGGDLLVLGVYQENLKNLSSLLADYALTIQEGVVFEGDESHHVANVLYCILPNVIDHKITSKLSAGKYVTLPTANTIVVQKNLPEELKVDSLLTTTNSSYLKVPDENGAVATQGKTDEDKPGPFRVGVYAKNEATGSEIVVYTGPAMFADDFFMIDSYANADLFANSISYMADVQEASSIRKIMFNSDETLVINASQATMIGIVCIILIPVCLMICGIAVMLVRKKR